MSARPARRVLITGVSRHLGGALAQTLQASDEVETVVGVDTVPPENEIPGIEFVRADIRNPLIAKVIAMSAIDTVVHLNVVATPMSVGGRTAMKELNVIGTMQLLAACQKAPSLRKLVVKSTSAMYGASSRDPALFTEDQEPRALPRGGYGKDAVEVEGYVRGFGRRRPDVAINLLRLVNVMGPRIDTPLSRYLAMPVVPTVLGYDPRLQLLHEDDALEILRLATLEDRPGTFNAAGSGVLLLSQALRLLGTPGIPVPSPAVNVLGGLARRARMLDISREQLRLLEYGRVVDTERLQNEFGYTPAYSTAQTLEDFRRGHEVQGLLTADRALAVEQSVLSLERRLVGLATGWRRSA
jgi:UDP-glucose 4-epimerase